MSFQQCFNYIAERFVLLVGGGIQRENNRHAESYKSNRKVVTNGAGTAHPSGAPCWVRVAQYLIICVVCCRSLLDPLLWPSSVLQFTASDYPFGIFKLFVSPTK
jgi:hypothetical protein